MLYNGIRRHFLGEALDDEGHAEVEVGLFVPLEVRFPVTARASASIPARHVMTTRRVGAGSSWIDVLVKELPRAREAVESFYFAQR